MVELVWRLRGQRVRFVSLLQTALDRQVLRQAGAVYQFRHAALHDLLASLHAAAVPVASGRSQPRAVPESVVTGTSFGMIAGAS